MRDDSSRFFERSLPSLKFYAGNRTEGGAARAELNYCWNYGSFRTLHAGVDPRTKPPAANLRSNRETTQNPSSSLLQFVRVINIDRS